MYKWYEDAAMEVERDLSLDLPQLEKVGYFRFFGFSFEIDKMKVALSLFVFHVKTSTYTLHRLENRASKDKSGVAPRRQPR